MYTRNPANRRLPATAGVESNAVLPKANEVLTQPDSFGCFFVTLVLFMHCDSVRTDAEGITILR
jgi:hypothetical protein